MNHTTLEICIDSVAGAVAAAEAGADRLEVCTALSEGGLTPSHGLIGAVVNRVALPVMVMIRPRGGDFVYSDEELDVMLRDIQAAKSLGARGVVFGVLTEAGNISLDANRRLLSAARPLEATFHRAFDFTSDPHVALEQLKQMGFDRVLTSGQQATAEAGISLLKQLNASATHPIIIAGSGVRPENAARIVRETKVREIHGSASTQCPGDPHRRITSAAIVQAIRAAIDLDTDLTS